MLQFFLVYQTQVKSPNTESKPQITNDQTNSRNINDVRLSNYENVENDNSTYTTLNRSALGDACDDHVYGNLNQVMKNIRTKKSGRNWVLRSFLYIKSNVKYFHT